MSTTSGYEDVWSPPPPVYELPYDVVPSSDPDGFVALGRGSATVYNTDDVDGNDEIDGNCQPSVVIGDASVVFYQGADDCNDVYMAHGLSGYIGNPSENVY